MHGWNTSNMPLGRDYASRGRQKQEYNLVMSGATSKIPKEFKILSSDDRISYVQNLWDFIAEDPGQVPIPESHKQVLNQRLAAHEAEPNHAEPWDQARDNILKKLQNT